MLLTFNEREVELVVSGSIDDYYVKLAVYTDDDTEVSDDDLEKIVDANVEEIEFELFEQLVGQAEDYYERD